MRAEQNAAQAFAGQKAGRGALDAQFFEALAALALEFFLGKRSVAREIGDQFENAGGKFGEARRSDRAGIRSGVRAEARAHAAQILFDLAAGARCGAGAHDGGRHFGEAGRAVRDDGVAAAEIKLRARFSETCAIPRGRLASRWRACEWCAWARRPAARARERERRAVRNGCADALGVVIARLHCPRADSRAWADSPAGV